VQLTARESFAEPNPNDSIPLAPAPIKDDAAVEGETTPHIPQETISIAVPNGEALDTPNPNANGGDAGLDESEGNLDSMGRPIPTDELFVKDAFLVFRALCKLSMKPLVTEK
jgi:brefeldin A-inhibited guanine nucleotide-exchange protein